jgi:hypothetical protein
VSPLDAVSLDAVSITSKSAQGLEFERLDVGSITSKCAELRDFERRPVRFPRADRGQ